MSQQYRWTDKSLDDLEEFYWREIAPSLRRDGFDPSTDRPPYQWMREQGFGGFIEALRRDHGLTPTQFYDHIDVGDEPGEYWGFVNDKVTRDLLEEWIESELLDRKERPQTGVRSIRSRLKKYVEIYREQHETTDLVAPLRDRDEQPHEIRRALAVFEELDSRVATDRAKFQYAYDIQSWYEYLIETGWASHNPLTNIAKRFDWTAEDTDGAALSSGQVRTMYEAADGRQKLMVVGLCGWGLRPSELAALHRDQLVLDPDDDEYPYIQFADGDRKNGPGSVTLLVGVDVLLSRVEALIDIDEWNGFLFPSERAQSGHIHRDTIRGRFHRLAKSAGVRVEGELPGPKMGRRFWYRQYSAAIEQIASQIRGIAEEQGSRDPRVVIDNYLSEAEQRKQRRTFMADVLTDVFAQNGPSVEAGG